MRFIHLWQLTFDWLFIAFLLYILPEIEKFIPKAKKTYLIQIIHNFAIPLLP